MTLGLLIAGLVLLVGAAVQGTIGFGLNLIAGPILALIDPMLVPVPVLFAGTALSAMLIFREHGSVEWKNVGWAMVGRLPGNGLGLIALATLPVAGFTTLIGVSVLVCVGLSVMTWKPRPTVPTLLVAGTASGAFGTMASIGGPPIALVYQNQSGPTIRSTLSAFFLVASISSLAMLAVAGHVEQRHLVAAALLIPFLACGALISNPLRKHVEGPRLRVGVLVVAALSALLLIGKSVF
ncbi:sulfite exporter TauE/SafE family protein [Actinokineospora xionganensis]|uniref:Probable membrane transporter protein n=1 Tax=Actinokineospora xionganensis TaxID=2684470 RepID=A0ABR7LED4_9PSEU|nr:sulfite exporter TauE/SafE family protein [Actinokineospora xionganensis]MBC6451010.1 sulfite exporter TauE/SafE family protein [Actinokineospora xionganensis]